MMYDLGKLADLAGAFMKAADFNFGGLKKDSIGRKIIEGMNETEKQEQGRFVSPFCNDWRQTNFFCRVAARQGLTDALAAFIPVENIDNVTVAALKEAQAPQFAKVVKRALEQ